eukprot:SAG11_NODE_9907_length_871_cov_1.064767_1_plen_58_part_00
MLPVLNLVAGFSWDRLYQSTQVQLYGRNSRSTYFSTAVDDSYVVYVVERSQKLNLVL